VPKFKSWYKISFCVLILFIATTSCRKQYTPAIINTPNSYLVVEGVINSGSDSTFIKLSRTVKLSSKVTRNPEPDATVTVEGDQNASYLLAESGNGIYSGAGLHLDNTHKYRLRIKTADGKQYLSDYVAVLDSPPIDSISYDTKGTPLGPGLNIYANTHDQSNKTRYYRWDYQETWIIHANFESFYKSNGDTVLLRDMINDNIYNCWQNDTSSTIILGSSAKLTQNVIFNNPIVSIVSTAEKLGAEYSINVRQYALSAEAYTFFTSLKKNTEQLGSIFDAQPSEIRGNIHAVNNASEPVIGFVCVGSSSIRRIFIKKSQLPDPWIADKFYTGCSLKTDERYNNAPCCYYSFVIQGDTLNQVDEFINYNKPIAFPFPVIPIGAIQRPGSPPLGYTAATKECADCTLRGTNKKPAFWE
jgi:hypothetical protein